MLDSDPIEIMQVANGFLVKPAVTYGDGAGSFGLSTARVFQSLAELSGFLQAHFSHRSGDLVPDKTQWQG